MIFDNPDFYPTPRHVVDQMIYNINLQNKVILEPSSGNGSIIDILREHSLKEILCCENNYDLIKISAQKADRFLCEDFLDVQKEDVSHIDYIIANPPFSQDEKHILHMWDILPEGAKIVLELESKTSIRDKTDNVIETIEILYTFNGL